MFVSYQRHFLATRHVEVDLTNILLLIIISASFLVATHHVEVDLTNILLLLLYQRHFLATRHVK